MGVRTELDQRFSEPGGEAIAWERAEQALAEAQLFWISTVRRDGRPHVTPLVAVWLDGVLHFCTGPGEQKALNLEGNPQVALTTGCNGWEDGLDVVVEARPSGSPTRHGSRFSPAPGARSGTAPGSSSRSPRASTTSGTRGSPTSSRCGRARSSPSARGPSATRATCSERLGRRRSGQSWGAAPLCVEPAAPSIAA